MLTRAQKVLHLSICMGRRKLPEDIRRSKIVPVRMSQEEFSQLESAAERLGISVGRLLREGAAHYIKLKSKDGHRKRKEI